MRKAAVQRVQGEPFVLMHEGGFDTHAAHGARVGVFDAKRRTRVARFTLDVYAPLNGPQQPNIGSIGISVDGVQAMNPNE